MKKTTNYQLTKLELSDSPVNIEDFNGNWDTIDTQLKKLSDEKFDKEGGTITGKTTISTGGLDVTGGAKTDSLEVTLTGKFTGKLTANGGVAVTGGTTTDTLSVTSTTALTGKVTANGGIEVTGDSSFKNNLNVAGILSMANPIRSTKAEFLQTQAPVVRGTAPANTTYNYWSVFDQNGWGVGANRLAHIDYTVDTNGVASLAMYVNKYVAGDSETGAGLYARWSGETAIIALTHHPVANSKDYSIATTKFVNDLVTNNKTQLVRW